MKNLAARHWWLIGGVMVGILALVVGWFALISPKREETAGVRQQVNAVNASNTKLKSDVEQLKKKWVNLAQDRRKLEELRTTIPQESKLPEFIRMTESSAGSNGLYLLKMSNDTPVVVPLAGQATSTTPAAAPSGSGTAKPSAGTQPQAAAPPPGLTLIALPVTFEVQGDFFKIESFLRDMQQKPRALLVTDIEAKRLAPAAAGAGKPASSNGDLTFKISGKIFVARDAEDATAGGVAVPNAGGGAAPASPTAGSAPTSGATAGTGSN